MKSRTWVPFLAGLLMLGLPLNAAAHEPNDGSLAAAWSFRHALGFNTDADYLATVAASDDATTEFGVPLTPDEAREIRRRNAVLDSAASLVKAVYSNPSEFAGVWLDHLAGGVLVVAVTSEYGLYLAEQHGASAVGAEIRQVAHPYAELAGLADRIGAQQDALRASGAAITGWYVDEIHNRVQVDLASATPEARAIVADRFGPAVAVGEASFVDVTCNYISSCTPWRGGIDIQRPFTGGTEYCTSGFTARPTGSSSTRYLLTAGHCGSGLWKHAGTTIGTTTRNSLDLTSPISDSQRIPMSPAGQGTPYNVIYLTTSVTASPITSQVNQVDATLGTTLCAAGRGSGYRCGIITARAYQHNVAGKIMYSTRADFGSAGGDSGGPVFSGHRAFGTVSQAAGGANGDTLFSPIDFVMTDLGTRLCLNSSCS